MFKPQFLFIAHQDQLYADVSRGTGSIPALFSKPWVWLHGWWPCKNLVVKTTLKKNVPKVTFLDLSSYPQAEFSTIILLSSLNIVYLSIPAFLMWNCHLCTSQICHTASALWRGADQVLLYVHLLVGSRLCVMHRKHVLSQAGLEFTTKHFLSIKRSFIFSTTFLYDSLVKRGNLA